MLYDHPDVVQIERTGYPYDDEPTIVTLCCGCGTPILEGEDIVSWEDVLMHDDADCIVEYVRREGSRKIAQVEG